MEYLIHLIIIAALYGVFAISLNLLVGETGLVSVAHAAFGGIGAYTTAIVLASTDLNFFIVAILAAALAGVVALGVGLIFLRLKEVYYVLGTVGFNVIAWSVLLNWSSFTKGPLGIAGIPRPELFGFQFTDNAAFLGLVMIALGAAYAISQAIRKSSFGRVLHAIREDENVVAVFGYSATHYKLQIFVIAAMMAGFGAAFYASYISYINPNGFMVIESIFVLAIVILGGLGSARGAVLGAFLLVILPELFRFIGFPSDIAAQLRVACYGLTLIFFMLYRPMGLMGKFRI